MFRCGSEVVETDIWSNFVRVTNEQIMLKILLVLPQLNLNEIPEIYLPVFAGFRPEEERPKSILENSKLFLLAIYFIIKFKKSVANFLFTI